MKRRSFFKKSLGAAIAALFGFKAAEGASGKLSAKEVAEICEVPAHLQGEFIKVWVNGNPIAEHPILYKPSKDGPIISTEHEAKITFESFIDL